MDTLGEGRLTFLLGGARSGKSRMAVDMARAADNVVFLATARPSDPEMARRVERHRAERPDDWRTVEAPLQLPRTIRASVREDDTVILDCLTLWVSNVFVEYEGSGEEAGPGGGDAGEDDILSRTDELISAIRSCGRRWIVVSNEVGTGLHPDTALGRRYRDLLGLVNQRVSRSADRAFLVVAGRPLALDRAPTGENEP